MKENQRITLTKKLLREGLLRLLKTKKLDKISVTELCTESGINRATFYRHYFVPHDILFEMQVQFVKDLHAMFGKDAAKKEPMEYLTELCTYLYDRGEVIKVFVKHNTEEDFIALVNLLVEFFIKEKRDAGEVVDIDDAGLSLISTYIAGGGYFMLRRWIVDEIEKSPAEMAELILKFVNREYGKI